MRNPNAPVPGIVEQALDIKALHRKAHRALIALQDAERAARKAVETAEKKTDDERRARLEMGRVLVEARKAWPARGPKAKGWGEFLRDLGIENQRAWELMKYAGYVEEISPPSTEAAEKSLPTYAQAGIKKAVAVDADGIEPDEPEVTDEEREASYRREVEASLPPRMEQAEKATHAFVAVAAEARASIRRLTEKNLHLTDVTTSPDDFMRAKQMLIDIANLCLEELANAGVLDGKERRRQMTLLKGGIE